MSEMKSRPILFTAPMVNAILHGHKTQTRRIVKPQPYMVLSSAEWHSRAMSGVDPYGFRPMGSETLEEMPAKCKYGVPGDRLWIKTGHRIRYDQQLNQTFWSIDTAFMTTHGKAMSKSGRQKRDGMHPGMFMPFWLSQGLALPCLEITGVRVERLQDISEADAMAEGCERLEIGFNNIDGIPVHPMTSTYFEAYKQLWESINGPGSWDANPWVWVIEFKKVE